MFEGTQWTQRQNPNTGEWEIVNVHKGNKRDYYRIVMGKYSPVIEVEPDRAFDAPQALKYVNNAGEEVAAAEKVAGIICKEGPRFSLTNAENKGIAVEVNEDGSINIDGESWWISTLFQKDKNRIFGYDAYCVKEKREVVKILELGDLDLF